MRRLLALFLVLVWVAPAAAQSWANPESPNSVLCQAAPGTGDATCPIFTLPALYKGFCAYAFDNASGASTWNLDLVALIGNDLEPFNWTVAGGASKAAANEGASCWYPTTITTLPTIFGAAIADQVVTTIPTRLRIVIDKTAAVSTQFSLYLYFLR